MKREEKNRGHSRTGDERRHSASGVRKSVIVLHVDDDPNDTALLRVACARAAVDFELQNVGDGEQVIQYLSGTGKYADRSQYGMPGMILLDLKMPRVEGLDVLKWIRNNASVKDLPVVVLSGSEFQDDVRKAYDGGADSYFIKPATFSSLITLAKEIDAQLPVSP